jgi:hypothetical protein
MVATCVRGAGREGRRAAERVVAHLQVGQLLRAWAADPGGCACSTARRRRATPACRTPSARRRSCTGRSSSARRRPVPSAWTSSTTLLQHGGVGGRQHAVAQVEDVAAVAAVARRSTSRASDRAPRRHRRRRPRDRGSPAAPCRRPAGPGRRRASMRQSTPTTSAPASAHVGEQLAGAHAEVDAGHAGGGHALEHLARRGAGRSGRSPPGTGLRPTSRRAARPTLRCRDLRSAARPGRGRPAGPAAANHSSGSVCISALVFSSRCDSVAPSMR